MNWYSPRADEVVAAAFGLKLDSILAVASRYSKLTPVVPAACLMEVAIFRRDESIRDGSTRDGSIAATAVALIESPDMCWCLAPRETPARSY